MLALEISARSSSLLPRDSSSSFESHRSSYSTLQKSIGTRKSVDGSFVEEEKELPGLRIGEIFLPVHREGKGQEITRLRRMRQTEKGEVAQGEQEGNPN